MKPALRRRVRVTGGAGSPSSWAPIPKMLIITQLDIEKMFNTVEEHHARGYSRAGYAVTYLYKTLNQTAGIRRFLKDTFVFELRARSDPELECFGFNPLCNYRSGYRADAEAAHDVAVTKPRAGLWLIRILSPLSALRDVFFVPSAVTAALLTRQAPWQVCIGFGPWGGLTAWILRRLGKARCFVYQDRDYEPGLVPYRLRSRYTAVVERFCIRRADLVCSIGFLLAERRRRESNRQVHVIPNGVDWARYASARRAASEEPILVYLGNLIDWAGLEHAIQAMPQIVKSFPHARLRIIGDGLPAYVATLKALVHAHDLDHCVEFLGQRSPDDLPGLLAGARIGLANSQPVPFRKFACPLKVMEYMAAGLPVIATRETEAQAMLERFDCGLSVDFDPGALAAAILRLLSDRPLWEAMRLNGIEASAALTWKKLVRQEIDLLRGECAASHPGAVAPGWTGHEPT